MREEFYRQEAQLAEHHWWSSARRKILRKVMQKYILSDPLQEILEVGCSTGSNFPMLSLFGKLTALEVNETAAAICKDRFPDINLLHQPIPVALDRKFDVICAFDVIEHIEDEDSTITWLHHHLQKNGWLFVTVPAMPWLWSEYDDDAHHFRRYTRDRLENILSKKFEIKYLTYFNTHLFPPIACVRLLQNMGALNLAGRDKEVGSQGIKNAILRAIFASETIWIPRLKLPFGVSILAVARRSASGSA